MLDSLSFVDRLASFGSAPAIVGGPDGDLSYQELSNRVDAMCERLGPERGLLLIEARNELEPLVAYLAALRSRFPVMLTPAGRDDLADSIIARYYPEWVYSRRRENWQLEARERESAAELHAELAVLLSTSGSTGTAKFVRLSGRNIESNASAIVDYLGIGASDCAATTLPFHYSYGLSVVNSHLMAGASLMLSDASVADPDFCDRCATHGVTSFAGVPYSFGLLDRVGFEPDCIPSLRYITQAGGRLPPADVERYRQMGERAGWRLFVMYGQTEATARMSFVPPELLAAHPGSIGVPIAGGSFFLVDDDGKLLEEPDTPGELVYRGPNVMMGYAEHRADLGRGPELKELKTGDIAQRDGQGIYTVVGRKKRFVKIFGLRVSLDEVEKKLAAEGLRAVATGRDGSLVIASLEVGSTEPIRRLIAEWSKLPASAVHVLQIDDFPLLPSGKIDYPRLQESAELEAKTREHHRRAASIEKLFQEATGERLVTAQSTFVDLGGDSLSYVGVSVALEKMLGYAPEGWERLTVAELEALKPSAGPFGQVEMSIALRAVAILGIAFGHFGGFKALSWSYPGGLATLLFVVSGFNFAKFQLANASKAGAPPVLRAGARVLMSTLAIMLPIQIVTGKLSWPTLLMYSNFIDPEMNYGMGPWFIQVLLQILVLLALFFSFPQARRMASRFPYPTFLSILALSTGALLLGPRIWNTTHLYDRMPHMLMYAFALGCCIELGKSLPLKWLNSALLLLLFFVGATHLSWVAVSGVLLLIWARRLWTVRPLNRAIVDIGGASLFIYLTHFNFAERAQALLGTESLAVAMLAASLGGVLLWLAADKTFALLFSLIQTVRSRKRPALLRSPATTD